MAKILVEFAEKSKLAKLFGVSRQTVNDALRFRTKSILSEEIRKKALERGGKISEMD